MACLYYTGSAFLILFMRLTLNKNQLTATYPQLLRQAGYAFVRDHRTGHNSFMRALARGHYPRFHLYVDENDQELIFNLHIDQKQPSYEGSAAHNGEYDGDLVAGEIERLTLMAGQQSLIKSAVNKPLFDVSPLGYGSLDDHPSPQAAPIKSWWQRIFK